MFEDEEHEEYEYDDGYSYCPICLTILPVPEDLNQDVVFRRIWDHIGTHSTWSMIKAWWRLRKYDKLKGKENQVDDSGAL